MCTLNISVRGWLGAEKEQYHLKAHRTLESKHRMGPRKSVWPLCLRLSPALKEEYKYTWGTREWGKKNKRKETRVWKDWFLLKKTGAG